MAARRSLLAAMALARLPRAAALSTSRPTSVTLRVASEEAMEGVGAAFGACAAAGTTICLSGDLGAGKTVFSRGFLRAAAGDSRLRVTSPTYLLDNAYGASDGLPDGLVVHHMDLYRLAAVEASAPLYMLDLPNVLETCCCLLEWPDRLGELPEPRLDVVIRAPDDVARVVTVDAGPLGDSHPPWLAALGRLRDSDAALA